MVSTGPLRTTSVESLPCEGARWRNREGSGLARARWLLVGCEAIVCRFKADSHRGRRPVGTTLASASSHSLQAPGRHCRQLMCTRAWGWPAPAPGPALVADADLPCCISEPFVSQHTVATDCRVALLQRKIKRL